MTALGLAIFEGYTEMVEMLVRAGAEIDYQNSSVSLVWEGVRYGVVTVCVCVIAISEGNRAL